MASWAKRAKKAWKKTTRRAGEVLKGRTKGIKGVQRQLGNVAKIGVGAAGGFLTGGPAGALAGAYGGYRAARETPGIGGRWTKVGQGIGAGLGLGAGMGMLGYGGGWGGGLYRGAAGLFGGGAPLQGPTIGGETLDVATAKAGGGGGWLSNLFGGGGGGGGKFDKILGWGEKLYGGYESAQQLKQANKLQRLQMNILEGLGEVSPEDYTEAERAYSTSMFGRGLGGSSLYGEGLAEIYPALQSQAKRERMYALGMMNQ